ncbi:MAG: hypothetical protein [Caudoviricetes sp.]|nr:MAG: hypothetical protein [Caudoviricetes sp.]
MSNPEILTYIPFAVNGEKNTIQVYRQANQDQEDATFSEGWPKITMIPLSSGGIPPKGLDINGVLYQLSLDTVHRQSGKQIQYDATYAKNIGGYSKGAILQSTDLTKSYISTVDNNLADPDSSSASGWNVYAQTPTATSTTTGTVKLVNNLASTDVEAALTAAQGKIIKDTLDLWSALSNGATIGAQTLPNGRVLMWGEAQINAKVTSIATPSTVAFQTPFPEACYQVVAIHNDSAGDIALFGTTIIDRFSFSASSFRLQGRGEGNPPVLVSGVTTMRYIAIGK